jgi:hypothetical protein
MLHNRRRPIEIELTARISFRSDDLAASELQVGLRVGGPRNLAPVVGPLPIDRREVCIHLSHSNTGLLGRSVVR